MLLSMLLMLLIIRWLLALNGAYDLACAAAIVWAEGSVLGRLHSDIWARPPLGESARLRLACWVCANGCARLATGLLLALPSLCAFTFVLEAVVFEYEARFGDYGVVRWRAAVTSVLSLCMGALALLLVAPAE